MFDAISLIVLSGGTQVAQKSLSAFVRPIGQLGQIQPGQNQLGQGTFGRVSLFIRFQQLLYFMFKHLLSNCKCYF